MLFSSQHKFSTKDMMQTLQSCNMLKKPKSETKDDVQKPPINWHERQAMKNMFLKKYLISVMIFTIICVVLIALPFCIAYAPFGKALVLALPPSLLISFSWCFAMWWAFDKGTHILHAVTVGAMPLRISVVLGWIFLCTKIPGIQIYVLVIGMMIFWAILMIPEVMLFYRFSQSLEPTTEIEPKN